MNHIQVHMNQDKKGDKTKIRIQQYTQLNTRAKEIQKLNPGGTYNRRTIKPKASPL